MKKGFTLIEVLIIIATIGILIVAIVPSLKHKMNMRKSPDANSSIETFRENISGYTLRIIRDKDRGIVCYSFDGEFECLHEKNDNLSLDIIER